MNRTSPLAGTQRGTVTIIVALMLAAASALAVAQFMRTNTAAEYQRTNAQAFQRAKDVLVAYAVTEVVVRNPLLPALAPTRPGELPCPDFDGDGYEDAVCLLGAVGRIPWKTLGIQESEVKDAAGETLWYAVSGPFRRSPQGALKINSDTTGDLVVYDASGNQITGNAAAVLFAPGPALAGQVRSGGALSASDYLEAYRNSLNVLIGNNGLTAGPFVLAPEGPSFNDQISVLTVSELIPRVEVRVATEIRNLLDNYQKNTDLGTMPWAVRFDAPLTTTTSQVGVNRGRLPLVALPDNWGSTTPEGRFLPALPAWFLANGWRDYLYYTFSGFLQLSQDGSCTTCTADFISFNGSTGHLALVMTPGSSRVGTRTPTNLSHYFESNDAADDVYANPPYTRLDQDHIVAVPTIPRTQCQAVASELAVLAPCGQPSRINGSCVRLATQIQACSCATAAVQLITTPCQNNLNPAVCQTAVSAISTCQ